MKSTAPRKPAPGKSTHPHQKRGNNRSVLLAQAVGLFAARGYDGVTVDEIVEAAGVNKRMVYHYFGSKQEIYRAALGDVFGDLSVVEEKLIAASRKDGDPVTQMRSLVHGYFRFLESHPAFVRLLLWENLAEGAHLGSVENRISKSPVLRHVEGLLAGGERRRLFRSGLDARLVLTSLIGLCLIHFSNRFTLSKSVGMDFGKPANRRQAATHAAGLLIAGLRK
jgi:AcrR family transcriptional regulator